MRDLALDVIDAQIATHHRQIADLERLRAMIASGEVHAAPGAPMRPSASKLPPYDPNDTNWAPPGRAAEKVGVAISTMRDWIADDTQNRLHRRIGKGRIYVYLPAVVGGSR